MFDVPNLLLLRYVGIRAVFRASCSPFEMEVAVDPAVPAAGSGLLFSSGPLDLCLLEGAGVGGVFKAKF